MAGIVATGTTAEAATRTPLKVSIANVGGVGEPRVGAVLDQRRPQIMVLSEAYNAREHLTAVAKSKGYRLRQYSRKYGAEAPGIALLVRNDVTIVDRTLLKMSEPWWYNGNKRQPRRYPAIVLRVDGRVWHVFGVHFPPGGADGTGSNIGGNNRAAWAESKRAVQAYAARNENPPVVAAGDFNDTASVLANRFPGFNVKEGGKVDHAISKKERGARFAWVSRDEAKSGHGWFSYKLTAI